MVARRILIERLIGWPVIAGMAVFAWLLTASITFVWVAGLAGQLRRPWLAWWLYATHEPDTLTKIYLGIGAFFPLFVGVVAAVVVLRARRRWITPRKQTQTLYGDAEVAGEHVMRANNITSIRSFDDA